MTGADDTQRDVEPGACDRDPVEQLASEFMDRLREGESPTVEEYTTRYPELADEIEEYFPAILAMEQLKQQKRPVANVATGSVKLERLGDFRLIREIGRGGMGIVYEAIQQSLGRQVAVKVLPSDSLHDRKKLQRFRREARTAAKLHHTNIVQVFGVGEHEGYHYFVMQLIRGVGLDEILGHLRHLRNEGDEHAALSQEDERRSTPVEGVVRALLAGDFQPVAPTDSNISDLSHKSEASATAQMRTAEMRVDENATRVEPLGDTVALKQSESSSGEASGFAVGHEPGERADTDATVTKDPLNPAYWRAIARIGEQVSDALQYAHEQGTLHRDIKPANLLLDGRGIVWVADFGLAKALEQDDVSRTGDIVGTLRYMAPEQFSGEADHRSDIYSLGLTLYELLTLRPAHEDARRLRFAAGSGEPPIPLRPRAINSSIPRDLETIVLKAIAHDPTDRYATAAALSADLRRFLEDRPILAKRAALAERFVRWCRRNPAVSKLSMLSVVLLLLIAVVASYGYVHTNQALRRESEARRQAEETLGISLAALDRVYLRFFAPDRHADAPRLTVQGPDGEELEVFIEPVLSKETLAFLEDLLGFYNKFAQQDSENVVLQAEAAKAIRRVGDIRWRLGEYELAIESYQSAIRRYNQLAAEHPTETQYRIEAARATNELGGVFFAQHDFAKADQTYAEALSMLEKLGDAAQGSQDHRFELARTYYAMGRRRQADDPMSLRLGPGGFGPRPRGRPGAGGRPGGPGRLEPGMPGRSRPPLDPLVGLEGPRGERAGRRGRPPGSHEDLERQQAHLKEAVELLEQLRGEDADDPRYRRLLAVCLRDLNPQSHPEGVQEALALLESLREEYPNVADYRFELGVTYAAVDPWRDSTAEIERRLRKAVAYSQQLVREHPNEPMYIESAVQMQHRLGMTLHRQTFAEEGEQRDAHLHEAIEHMQRALKGQQRIVDRYPDAWTHRFLLSRLTQNAARLQAESGDFDAAKDLLLQSISQLDEYVQDRERNGLLQIALFNANSTLADIGRRMGPAGEEIRREAQRRARIHQGDLQAGGFRGRAGRGNRGRPFPPGRGGPRNGRPGPPPE